MKTHLLLLKIITVTPYKELIGACRKQPVVLEPSYGPETPYRKPPRIYGTFTQIFPASNGG
jgi:hypothetical protein